MVKVKVKAVVGAKAVVAGRGAAAARPAVSEPDRVASVSVRPAARRFRINWECLVLKRNVRNVARP